MSVSMKTTQLPLQCQHKVQMFTDKDMYPFLIHEFQLKQMFVFAAIPSKQKKRIEKADIILPNKEVQFHPPNTAMGTKI